jgi:predicted N-acyltransferase
MITVTEVDALASVPAAEWDSLASAASLYQSHAWLRWAEAYHRLPTRYVLARDADGMLLGAVATYLMRDVPDKLAKWYDPVRVFLAPYCESSEAEQRWFPVLLVGGCSGGQSEILYTPGLDRSSRGAVTRALLARCRAIAEDHECGSLAFMYALKEACDEVADALSEPARKILTSAKAVLTLDAGGDFDSYLHRFSSARRRNPVREVRDFEAAGGTAATYHLGEVAPRVAPLLGAHQRKFGNPATDAETLRYLRQQETYLGAASTVFVDEQDGSDIRGFALTFTHGDTLYGRACGFAPQGAAPFAYFNLTVYAPIRHAVEHGLTTLELGLGSYEAKRRRGAEVVALWSVVVPPEDLAPQWTRALGRPAPQALFAGVT